MTELEKKALHWASKFPYSSCLLNNQFPNGFSDYDMLIAVAQKPLFCKDINTLDSFLTLKDEWKFGYFSYELKDNFEPLSSTKTDKLNFETLFYFIPEYILALSSGLIKVLKGSKMLVKQIENEVYIEAPISRLKIKPKLNREAYLNKIKQLQSHIFQGNIYEVNFCQEFFAENAQINPIDLFCQLNSISPMPFAGFLRHENRYILSASPERFIQKKGKRLISQPIKGTNSRKRNFEEDIQQKEQLQNSVKERAENIMIVDLVRNDLTKVAIPKTVQVSELMKIYSFKQVHQMISTIECEIKSNLPFSKILAATFPMGSMTGAPKISAMQLIEEYESSKRGVYSGSMGYVMPNGDFDFNVIIRSILYNAEHKYLSFQTGSAITALSNPEDEYEECLLKAKSMLKILDS